MPDVLRPFLSVLTFAALVGCSEPAAPEHPSGETSSAPGPADSGPPGRPATLALEGEGLRVFIAANGSSRPIPFGTGKAEALRMLEAVQGAPPRAQGENIDCGATNATWPDGLTVWFARDRFVGWSLAPSGSPLSTAGGLGLGTTRAELEQGASVAEIQPSSLGEEFTAGGVGGLLESADAGARVTHLWAGAACIAR